MDTDQLEESQRLQALRDLDILDTPPEQEFDDLVRLASEICGTPISMFSLVDSSRQWFKARVGISDTETSRSISICSHAIETPGLFVVENVAEDPRFSGNSNVTGDPNIRFYAGMPLLAPSGAAVGTLCVIDTIPRTLTESQKNALVILGTQVQARMELRAKQKSLQIALAHNDALNLQLSDRNELFLAFMNNGPFVSYVKDADGRMIFYNARCADQFGIDTEEWIGRRDEDNFPAEIAAPIRRNDEAVLAAGKPVEMAEITTDPAGVLTHWKSYKFPIRNTKGAWMLAGMSIDVTEELHRQAELEQALEEKLRLAVSLESSNILFQTFVDINPNICYFKSEDGKYVSYNAKFAELFGIDGAAWIGKSDSELQPKELADDFEDHDRAVLESGIATEYSLQLTSAAGHAVWLKSIKFPIRIADGSMILAGVAVDVTRELEKEHALSVANAQLEQLATTDTLTGLCNRRVFESGIASGFSQAMRNDMTLSLVALDIDDFKRRNDTYGHAAGDQALRALGSVLLGCVRDGDVAARVGGEEFAVLLHSAGVVGAKVFAARLQSRLAAADCGPGGRLTVSMGITTLTAATSNWEEMVREADDAMYQAKRGGKNRFVVSSAFPASEAVGI